MRDVPWVVLSDHVVVLLVDNTDGHQQGWAQQNPVDNVDLETNEAVAADPLCASPGWFAGVPRRNGCDVSSEEDNNYKDTIVVNQCVSLSRSSLSSPSSRSSSLASSKVQARKDDYDDNLDDDLPTTTADDKMVHQRQRVHGAQAAGRNCFFLAAG